MDKKQLLLQLEAAGLSVTRFQLNRYIEYGFISGVKEGMGYGKSVKTTYPMAVEIIGVVESNKSSPYIKHIRDIIFILFWMGYPVNLDKLKRHIIEFRDSIMLMFESITEHSSNTNQAMELAERLAEKDTPIRRPGRPTNEEVDHQKKQEQKEIKKNLAFIEIIKDITRTGTVAPKTFEKLIQTCEETFLTLYSDVQDYTSWIDYKSWLEALDQVTTADLQILRSLLTLLKEYWNIVISSNIPNQNAFIKLIITDERFAASTKHPMILRLFITVLLASGLHDNLLQYLKSQNSKDAWLTFCNEYAEASSMKGGDENE